MATIKNTHPVDITRTIGHMNVIALA
ncbi:unnamed protein product, partial [Rotaria sp. Silwood1]